MAIGKTRKKSNDLRLASSRPVALATPEIAATITVGQTPPTATSDGTPGTEATLGANLLAEYVSSGGYTWLANYVRSLPQSIDDVTRDFADDLYERMLFDPQVAAAINALKFAVLADGVELQPAVTDAEHPDHGKAAEIAAFCGRCIEEMETPIDEVLFELLDALALGNRVAEQVYALGTGEDAGRLVLRALKVKPRESLSFVVDAFQNTIGLLARIPGVGLGPMQGTLIGDVGTVPNLLPREKFAVLTMRPKNGDPRGTSLLRPAYNAWWAKQQIWPEYLKYLARFASPSLWAATADDAQPQTTDAAGNWLDVPLTPEQVLAAQLVNIANGSVVVVPFGTTVNDLIVQGDGQAFAQAFALCDRQIVKATTSQTLATEEAEHESRAASQVHQDVLGMLVRQIRQAVARTIRRDVLRQLVRLNFGDAATALTPTLVMGETEVQDIPALATAYAALAREGYFDSSQLPGLDMNIGAPPRSSDDMARRQQMALAGLQGAMAAAQAAAHPDARAPGDTKGEQGDE